MTGPSRPRRPTAAPPSDHRQANPPALTDTSPPAPPRAETITTATRTARPANSETRYAAWLRQASTARPPVPGLSCCGRSPARVLESSCDWPQFLTGDRPSSSAGACQRGVGARSPVDIAEVARPSALASGPVNESARLVAVAGNAGPWSIRGLARGCRVRVDLAIGSQDGAGWEPLEGVEEAPAVRQLDADWSSQPFDRESVGLAARREQDHRAMVQLGDPPGWEGPVPADRHVG